MDHLVETMDNLDRNMDISPWAIWGIILHIVRHIGREQLLVSRSHPREPGEKHGHISSGYLGWTMDVSPWVIRGYHLSCSRNRTMKPVT